MFDIDAKGQIRGMIDDYWEKNSNLYTKYPKGQIASFGPELIFRVSSNFVHTFSDLQRTFKAKWAIHDVIASKAVSEFLSPDLEEISMNILLFQQEDFYINNQIVLLKNIVESGTVYPFVLAGSQMGDNDFYIESADINYKYHDHKGVPVFAEVSIKLKEYIRIKKEYDTGEQNNTTTEKQGTVKVDQAQVDNNNKNV